MTERLKWGVPLLICALSWVTPAMGGEARELPSVDEVLAHYVKSLGGDAALRDVASLQMSGTVRFAGADLEGRFDSFYAGADRFRFRLDLGDAGIIETGIIDGVGWDLVPGQPADLMSESELLKRRCEALVHPFEIYELFESVRVVERVSFSERPCYVLRVRATDLHELHYFDVDSGLKLGHRDLVGDDADAPTKSTSLWDGYRRFGDLMFPTVISVEIPSGSYEATVEILSRDPVLSDVFVPPAEVLALMNAED